MNGKVMMIALFVFIIGVAAYVFLLKEEEKEEEESKEKENTGITDDAEYYNELWEPPEEPKHPVPFDNKIRTPNYVIAVELDGDYKVEFLKIDYAFKAGEHIANKISIASNYNEVIRLTRIALQEMFPEIRVEPDEEILYAFAYKIWGIHEAYKQAGVYSFYVAVEYKDAIVQLIERRFREDISNNTEFIKKEWAPGRNHRKIISKGEEIILWGD